MAGTSPRCHMSLIKKHLQGEPVVEDDLLPARAIQRGISLSIVFDNTWAV